MTEVSASNGDEPSTVVKTSTVEKKMEEITSYEYDDKLYQIGDTVYIESQRSDMPYFICSIRDFKRSKKDNVTVDVVWYYRPCEIPTSVYQLLLQDRNAENGSTDHVLENPVVKDRELFISDAIDVFPASALRGHAICCAFSEVKDTIMGYISQENNWFYILRYNPESRRMANAKGEIRIGASHQAILPAYVPLSERSKTDLKELQQTCKEDLCWEPIIKNSKLAVYLRAARSITSYSGFCEAQDGTTEKTAAINALPDDNNIAYSYDMLHQYNYNISEALQYLIKNPVPKEIMTPWTEDERKRFMRGLRSYGKTFHKIRKELLPERTTSDLVHYYYIWKKTSIALSSRPHKKCTRRNNVRKTRTTKPKTSVVSEFLDLSSCSENEVHLDCENNSDNERDVKFLYACRHCYSTRSPNWHHAGKDKLLLCHECRIHFKRYGHMKPLIDGNKREPPPFIYKAAFENVDDASNYSGRMRTRRSSTPVFTNGASIRSRILQDAKVSNRKQMTTPTIPQADDESIDKALSSRAKRKNEEENGEDDQDVKKSRLSMREEENAEDADDESDGDSVLGVNASERTNESSRSISPSEDNSSVATPVPIASSNTICRVESAAVTTSTSTFVPIKEEVIEMEIPQEVPHQSPRQLSSPDICNDDELNKKVASRFKHNVTEVGNSCSRCEMIFTFKKPKKQRPSELENSKRKEEMLERSRMLDTSKFDISPPSHQPAQITSHYETMRLFAQHQAVREPQRLWHGFQHPPDIHDHHRSISPRDFANAEQASKYSQLLKAERALPEHLSPRTPSLAHQSHPGHPFPPRVSEQSREFRMAHGDRPHISPHGHGNMEALSRFAHDPMAPSIIPPMDRPTIDPITGLPSIQPHLHSHLHTHTHLHVHPDDIKYRGHGVHPSENHHERSTPHHIVPPLPHPPRRPSSAGREYHDNVSLLLQHDPHLSRHIPPNSRGETPHPPISREGAISPSFPREQPSRHSDPVAYHLWLTQLKRIHQRPWSAHGGNGPPPHSQAPDLSPHGLPGGPPIHAHHPHIRSDHEKHLHEKLIQAEREKIAREKHMRHILQTREHMESKMKSEHMLHERGGPFKGLPSDMLHERVGPYKGMPSDMMHERGGPYKGIPSDMLHERGGPYKGVPSDMRSPYPPNTHFLENMRRTPHDNMMMQERSIHERFAHERLERDRIAQIERAAHTERFERSRHDRPSIFGHYKPETIDLSED